MYYIRGPLGIVKMHLQCFLFQMVVKRFTSKRKMFPYVSLMHISSKKKVEVGNCYLGIKGFLREMGALNTFILHLSQAVVSFEEYF